MIAHYEFTFYQELSDILYMRQKRMEFVRARQGKTCLKQQETLIVIVSSKDVHKNVIQDKYRPMTIAGSDVISLYPNLTRESEGEEV